MLVRAVTRKRIESVGPELEEGQEALVEANAYLSELRSALLVDRPAHPSKPVTWPREERYLMPSNVVEEHDEDGEQRRTDFTDPHWRQSLT